MKRYIFISLVLLGACTSLNTVTSLSESNEDDNRYRYHDSRSKIRYQITNDDKDLHIKLNTSDKGSIMKILKTGLTFYFDVKGKKRKDVYFQYPIAQDLKMSGPDRTKKQNELELEKLFLRIPTECIYSSFGETEYIYFSRTEHDIIVSIKALTKDEIIYDLIIPFSRITDEGFSSLSNLSVGVVSGKFEIPSSGGSVHGSMGSGSGSRSSGSSRHSGSMYGERSGSIDISSMNKAIDFWFKVDLHGVNYLP